MRAWVGFSLLWVACGGGHLGFVLPPPPDHGHHIHDLGPPSLDGNLLPLDGGVALGQLTLTAIDHDSLQPVPARVIFRPPPGAGFADSITSGMPDPLSPGGAIGASVGPGVLGSPEGVLLQAGTGVVPVPPGTYRLFFTRGPEYEGIETSVTVAAGEMHEVTAELSRSVDTRGWLAADLHVHTGRSYDAKLLVERRVVSMVTNGVELIVSTDHNVATDLQPAIAQLGYDASMVGSLVGNEFNFRPGHGGAYPVPYDAMKIDGGAPSWQNDCNILPITGPNCLLATDAFALMHSFTPSTVVTINHPYWAGGDLGYFTNIPWGAGTANPLPATLATEGQFDAIELLNGYQAADGPLTNLLADWFYLLSRGNRVTALGSSDTHRINWVRAGFPRSWLRLPTDNPGEVTGEMLADAIRNQRVIASTGPFVNLTVDGKPIGDTVIPNGGKVSVEVTVDAPNWIKVDKVKIYVGSVVKHSYDVTPGQRPVFHVVLDEPIAVDTFIVALATGRQPLPPDAVGEYSEYNGYEMLPWAITNPVFIDANGDGQVHPMYRRMPEIPQPPLRRLPNRSDACDDDRRGVEPPLDAPGDLQRLMPLLFR